MISPPYFPTGLLWLALGLIISLSINLASRRISAATHRYACLIYRVAIPYLSILTGAISPYLMGLSNIDWATSLGIGAGLSFAVLLILALINIALLNSQNRSSTTKSGVQINLSIHAWPKRQLFNGAVWALAEQFYWAFNRAAIWEFLLRAEPNMQVPAYHALWITGLTALPDTLMHTTDLQNRLGNVGIFIATSILFFFTHNFWLCAFLHLAMVAMLHTTSPGSSSSTHGTEHLHLARREKAV